MEETELKRRLSELAEAVLFGWDNAVELAKEAVKYLKLWQTN